jgi:hemolysin activation/secretion protein
MAQSQVSAGASAQQASRESEVGRAQIEQNVPPKDVPRKTQVRVETSGAIAELPCALSDSDINVTISSLVLERPDGSALPAELLTLLTGVDADLHGEAKLSVVCKIRDRINERLAEAGYIALAQIPAQKITDGVLKIQVVTAHIIEVRVVGEPGRFRKQLEKAVERIRAIDPLNRRDAIRELLQVGDIPGLDVNLTLSSANAAPGEMIGTLNVATQRQSLMVNFQNFGSRQLGRWIGSIRGEVYGLTGRADRTFVAYSNSTDVKEIRVLQAGHDFALNESGLRLGLRTSLAWSRPDIDKLDLRSRSVILGLEMSQSLVRNLKQTVVATGGFELLDQQAQIVASGNRIPFSLDKIRVLFGRLDGDFRFTNGEAEWMHATGSLELRKGIGILGATKIGQVTSKGAPSRLFGNPQAFIIKGEANLDIHPIGAFHLGLNGFGQWSNDPLLNLEEFSVGNYTRGRGYDPGSSGGDRAYGFTLEPRVVLPIPKVRVEASGFYDWVHVQNIDPGTAVPNQTLRSVGGGLRFVLPQRLVVDVTFAHPLDKLLPTDKAKPSNRVLVSLTSKFF